MTYPIEIYERIDPMSLLKECYFNAGIDIIHKVYSNTISNVTTIIRMVFFQQR